MHYFSVCGLSKVRKQKLVRFVTGYYTAVPGKTRRSTFNSYVWARNIRHARTLCKKRGLGERVQGYSRKAKAENAAVLMPGEKNFTHWLCFLGFVALKAGYTPEQLFSDTGILHDLMHNQIRAALTDDPTGAYVGLCRDLGFLP